MDKVVPVLSGVVAATYWTTALLWTAAYYITIPLHYPAYYLLRLVAVILSPAWYVFKGIGSALGVAAALIAKLKFLYIFLASAAFIGIAAGCLLYGTSTFIFILLGVDPARDRQFALEAEHRRQQRVLRKLHHQQQPGLISRLLGLGSGADSMTTRAGHNPIDYRAGRGGIPLSSSSAAGAGEGSGGGGGGGPSAFVGTLLARALNGLGYDPSSWVPSSSSSLSRRWPGPPPSYHTTQALSPPATNITTTGRLVLGGESGGGAHMYRRQKSSKLSLDVDIDDSDDDDDDDDDENDVGDGNVRRSRPVGSVDEQELSDLAANEQDEQSYRESTMEDWLSNSSSVAAGTTTTAAAPGPRTSSSKAKGKMKARQKTDDKCSSLQQQHEHEQSRDRDIDHADPLQEHRDLLDTQWKRIRSLDHASKQQHTIGGGGGGTSGGGAGSGSRRGVLLSQTIHEESSETESL